MPVSSHEDKFKFFTKEDLNGAVVKVEAGLLRHSPDTQYVEVDKLRFMTVKALHGYMIDALLFRTSPFRRLLSLGPRKTLRALWRSFTRPVCFTSSSDVLHIRNNLSLFYISGGFRVKVFLPDGVRSSEEFKHEYQIRKQFQANNTTLHVPCLIGELVDGDVCYFVDEFVSGESYGWVDARGDAVLREVVKKIWDFYVASGIHWDKLSTNGIGIDALLSAYESKDPSEQQFTSEEIALIRSFADKKIPSSLIHGDLSLGNIIMAKDKAYLIDWELSRHDLLIKDLYKILSHKEEFFEIVGDYMQEQIQKTFSGNEDSVLSLREQYLLERLIRSFP